jgi:hypothetical protein
MGAIFQVWGGDAKRPKVFGGGERPEVFGGSESLWWERAWFESLAELWDAGKSGAGAVCPDWGRECYFLG